MREVPARWSGRQANVNENPDCQPDFYLVRTCMRTVATKSLPLYERWFDIIQSIRLLRMKIFNFYTNFFNYFILRNLYTREIVQNVCHLQLKLQLSTSHLVYWSKYLCEFTILP